MRVAVFMASPGGRIGRMVMGVVLIVAGFIVGGGAGWAISVVGLVPFLTGAANVCILAPILNTPFKGANAGKGATR